MYLPITYKSTVCLRNVHEFCKYLSTYFYVKDNPLSNQLIINLRWVNCTVEIVRDDENEWGEIYENLTGVGVLGNVIEDRADLGISKLF